MSDNVEYAGASRGGSDPMEFCARYLQAPIETVLRHRDAGTLAAFIEQRKYLRRPTGREALREIDAKRHASWDERSPQMLIGELRARRAIWEIEEWEIVRRPRDPWECLDDLYARQVPDWFGG